MAAVKRWNRLPRKALGSPPSEMFSTRQSVAQSNLVCGGSAPQALSNINRSMIPSNIDLMSEAGYYL